MLVRLDHVRVRTRDCDAAIRDYASLLGRGALDGPVAFEVGGTGLAFEPAAQGEREGVAGLVFAVGDTGAFRSALAERGIACQSRSSPPRGARALERFDLDPRATRGVEIGFCEAAQAGGRDGAAAARGESGAVALDHAVVMTPDHAAAIRLFGDVLGLRLALDRSFPGRGVRLLFFRIAGVTVEVGGPIEPPPEPEAVDRFYGLAWRTNDLLAWRARLLGEGFDVSEHRAGNKQGTRVCTVRSRTAGVPTLLIGPDSIGGEIP